MHAAETGARVPEVAQEQTVQLLQTPTSVKITLPRRSSSPLDAEARAATSWDAEGHALLHVGEGYGRSRHLVSQASFAPACLHSLHS